MLSKICFGKEDTKMGVTSLNVLLIGKLESTVLSRVFQWVVLKSQWKQFLSRILKGSWEILMIANGISIQRLTEDTLELEVIECEISKLSLCNMSPSGFVLLMDLILGCFTLRRFARPMHQPQLQMVGKKTNGVEDHARALQVHVGMSYSNRHL